MKKINANCYDTDKKLMPRYLENYEIFFSDFVNEEVKLFELGINKGGSLLMWCDYFKKGNIVGLDINKVCINDKTGRIKCYEGSQDDINLLNKIAKDNAPDGFDIIIDDCAHIGSLAKASFNHIFNNHLKNGGIYVIEDWGTGYWDSWPDGKTYISKPKQNKLKSFLQKKVNKKNKFRIKSHDYGMVGFIKELIDECGMGDITNEKFGIPPKKAPKIKRMQISSGIVFIEKA